MNNKLIRSLRHGLALTMTLCTMFGAGHVAAQSAADKYPEKAIKIVVPFPPGGSTDTLGRAIAQKLQEKWGQPVVVENRPGASTLIGSTAVAKAAPDGYTLLLVGASIATNPALIEKLPYKTPDDFTPIGTVITYAMGFAARANLPANNVQELLALIKAKGPLSIATSGDGSATALANELFKGATGAQLMAVPYKGAGPAAIDVASGHVDVLFTGMSQLKPHLDTGRVKLLATSGSTRLASAPDVPTIAEQGIKDFEAVVWWGILAPAKTPTAIVNKLNQALTVSLNHPDVMKRLAVIDGEVRLSSPQAFEALLKDEIARWAKLYAPQAK